MASGESHAAKQDAWGRNLADAIPPEIPLLRPVLSGGFNNAAIGSRNRIVNQTADTYRNSVTDLQTAAANKSVASSKQYESDIGSQLTNRPVSKSLESMPALARPSAVTNVPPHNHEPESIRIIV